MMNILLMRSGGSFSLFTQSVVVLMEKPGLQEMIEKNKMMVSKIANNLDLLILYFIKVAFGNKEVVYSLTIIMNIDFGQRLKFARLSHASLYFVCLCKEVTKKTIEDILD